LNDPRLGHCRLCRSGVDFDPTKKRKIRYKKLHEK